METSGPRSGHTSSGFYVVHSIHTSSRSKGAASKSRRAQYYQLDSQKIRKEGSQYLLCRTPQKIRKEEGSRDFSRRPTQQILKYFTCSAQKAFWKGCVATSSPSSVSLSPPPRYPLSLSGRVFLVLRFSNR